MGSRLMEPDDVLSYAAIYEPAMTNTSICWINGMINSKGIFRGSDPFDYSSPILLAQLSMASSLVLLTSFFLKPLRQSTMVIQILGGLILGPSFLGRAPSFTSLVYPFKAWIIIDTLSIFACTIYFFLIGLQIDPMILKKIQWKDILIGISTVLTAIIISMSATFTILALGLPSDENLGKSLPVVAMSSSVLSFPVMAHYLNELKMINSEFGRMALSSSLISNLFSFCIITPSVVIKGDSADAYIALETLASGLGIAIVIFFVIRPLVIRRLEKYQQGETLKQGFIFMIFVGILMTGLCGKAFGLSIFYGPFLYGMALPVGPPLGSALVEKLDFTNSWLFMPLYFAKNGLIIDIFSVKFGPYLVVQTVILFACVGKFLGAMISSICLKVPLREAVQIGLVMNVRGIMELFLFKMMKHHKTIVEDALVVLIISMLITTSIITPLLRHLYDPLRRHASHKRRTVMDLKPNSDLRVVTCVHDQENVPTLIDLIESLRPTKTSPINICLIHLVEMVGRATPILVTHKLNKLNSRKTSTSKTIVNAFKQFHEKHIKVTTLHPFTAISTYASMHDDVCEIALNCKAALIITPYHQRQGRTGGNIGESSEAGMKLMNDNLLKTPPCSVAIIVDRGPTMGSRVGSINHVAVLFIGGPDDREALSIGARMVSSPNIKLTIIRIMAEIEVAEEDLDEARFDNDAVHEFRSQMENNSRVSYFEEAITDGVGTVSVIRSMENDDGERL